MSNFMASLAPQPEPWQSSGNPYADYKELSRIFQGGLAERRAGRNADAFVARNMGHPDTQPQTMEHLSSLIAYVAKQGGEPMTEPEKATGMIGMAGNRALLGWPKHFLPPAEQDPMNRLPQQDPNAAKLSSFAGGVAPYTMAAASGNPWLAGLGAAGAGAVEAASEPGATPLSIGGGAAAAGVPTLVTAGLLHGIGSRMSPGAESLEQMIKYAGGEEHLLEQAKREIARTPGVPPLLAELNPIFSKAATRGVPLTAPEMQPQMIADATAALKTATDAKSVVGAKYDPILAKPITDPKVAQVLQRPIVQSFLKELHDAGMLPENQITGRALNDLRMLLTQRSAALADQLENVRDPVMRGTRHTLDKAAGDLTDILERNVKGFAELQKEYQPYIERVNMRQEMLDRLAGPGDASLPPGRGTGLLPPGATSVKGQLSFHAGQEP